MATTGGQIYNLVDVAKSLDPQGNIAAVAEILNETNEILQDIPWLEGNLPTGHRYTVRTGLPEAYWRLLNQGIPKSKSSSKQVTESAGILETQNQIDKDLAELNGNTNEFFLREDKAFIESLSQELAAKLFYGNVSTDPEQIMGLAPRYSDLSADNADHIINAGGTGSDNTSIWLVVWKDDAVYGFYPKGSRAGLEQSRFQNVMCKDENSNEFEGHKTIYKWKPGLAVADWRYVVRIANIDVSDLSTFNADTDNSANLIRDLIKAYNKIPNIGSGRAVIYCNETVKTWLDIMAGEKNNVQLSIQEWAGQPVTTFWGVPIRKCDAILNTEEQVT